MTRQLLLLNGLAALGVTTYHASAYGFSALFLWTDRYRSVTVPNYDQLGSLSYYALLMVRQLDSYVIPAFIFVSGFFIAFAASGQSTLKWDVVLARIKKFLVPLFIWTVIRYILLRQFPSSLHDVLRQYYFIVLLVQFYLLSPFIVPLAKTHWKLLLFGSALIQFGAESIFVLSDLGLELPNFLLQVKSMLPLWFFPLRIFWFAFGVVAGFYRQSLGQWLAGYRWGLLSALFILGSLTIIEYETLARVTGQDWLGPSFRGVSTKLYAIIFILCFLAFDRVSLPLSKQLSYLGGKSLGIYLVNIPAIYVVAVLMYHQTPWILGYQLLYQAILIIVGLGVPLLLMAIVSKSRIRWAYQYLFG